ncbi:MAG TPA: heavy metal-associated domain-containing protein [Chitinophagaceae bacterium]|nr:heavy metal-associated domain-containing protein [Chitinophagaceae bacterium]
MKKLLTILLFSGLTLAASAQFTRARLQATGLTCAMCSNAVNKALQELPFVEKVYSDIRNSAFDIRFRKDVEMDIDALKLAVEDAGFSVGSLALTGNFTDLKIGQDAHVKFGKDNFHFVNVTDQVLEGEKTIQVVDQGFLTPKEQKKYSSATAMSCYKDGKAAECCEKEGVPRDTRIYHVTI